MLQKFAADGDHDAPSYQCASKGPPQKRGGRHVGDQRQHGPQGASKGPPQKRGGRMNIVNLTPHTLNIGFKGAASEERRKARTLPPPP